MRLRTQNTVTATGSSAQHFTAQMIHSGCRCPVGPICQVAHHGKSFFRFTQYSLCFVKKKAVSSWTRCGLGGFAWAYHVGFALGFQRNITHGPPCNSHVKEEKTGSTRKERACFCSVMLLYKLSLPPGAAIRSNSCPHSARMADSRKLTLAPSVAASVLQITVAASVWDSTTGSFCLSGLVWSGLVWSGLVWSGLVWSGLVWSGLVWSGLVWSGLVWSGLVWSGLVWSGLSVCNFAK